MAASRSRRQPCPIQRYSTIQLTLNSRLTPFWGPPFEAHHLRPTQQITEASHHFCTEQHTCNPLTTHSHSQSFCSILQKKPWFELQHKWRYKIPCDSWKKKYRHIVRSSTYRILCLLTLDSASASKNTHFPFCLCAVKKHVAIWSSGTATCIFDNEKKDWCNKQNFYLC